MGGGGEDEKVFQKNPFIIFTLLNALSPYFLLSGRSLLGCLRSRSEGATTLFRQGLTFGASILEVGFARA